MKNNILNSVLLFFITAFMYSQSAASNFNVGDVFLIGTVKYNNYKYINFPRANFIIKKGGIANYKNIRGEKVVIIAIEEKNNGKHVATIKLSKPRKFFNSYKYVTVDVHQAIKNNELLRIQE